MLSIQVCKMTPEGAARYYSKNFHAEDYYVKGEEPQGKWHNADNFSLDKVSQENLRLVLEGRDPSNPDKRLTGIGGKTASRQSGWDMTFSAPKSVSLIWAVADTELKEKISEAQERAVHAAMKYATSTSLENSVRRVEKGLDGKKVERWESPARCLYTTFEHRTNRELEPQLHTHTLLANMAERKDGTWGSLKVSQYGKHGGGSLYKDKKLIGALYRAELAFELQKLGFTIEQDRQYFRVAEVPKNLEVRFSSRRQQILNDLEDKGLEGAGKEAAISAVLTRGRKRQVPQAELSAQWAREMSDFGFSAEQLKSIIRKEIEVGHVNTQNIYNEAIKDVSDKDSTFTVRNLYESYASKAVGSLNASSIVHKLWEISSNIGSASLEENSLVKLKKEDSLDLEVPITKSSDIRDDRIATSKQVVIEKEMLESARVLVSRDYGDIARDSLAESLVHFEKQKSIKFSDEQIDAIGEITSSKGLVLIEGMAGTGKSKTLEAAKDALTKHGYKVLAMAPTGRVAHALSEDFDVPSSTVSAFVSMHKGDSSDNKGKKAYLVDEAGMIDSENMSKVLKIAREENAKVVLVGDSRQFAPIQAGGAFDALKDEFTAAKISEIRRQSQDWQRQAVHDFADAKAFKALVSYQEQGRLYRHRERADMMYEVSKGYVKNVLKSGYKNSLVVAHSNREIDLLNQSIRGSLLKEGLVEYGQSYTLKTRNGEEFNSKLGKGERILFLRNSKALGVTNGMFGIIESIDHESGKIHVKTDNQRGIDFNLKDYNYISQGYAVTSYKSQGATIDNVAVVTSPSIDRSWSYVSMSRHSKVAKVHLAESDWLDKINWKGFDRASNLEKTDTTLKHAMIELSKKMDTIKEKETTWNWETKVRLSTSESFREQKVFVTPELINKINCLERLSLSEEGVKKLYDIALMPSGVQNRLFEPARGETPWSQAAREALSSLKINKESINKIKESIKGLPMGKEPIRGIKQDEVQGVTRVFDNAYKQAQMFEREYSSPELRKLANELQGITKTKMSSEDRLILLAKIVVEPRGIGEGQRLWNAKETTVQKRAKEYLSKQQIDGTRLKQLGKTIFNMPEGQTAKLPSFGVELQKERRDEVKKIFHNSLNALKEKDIHQSKGLGMGR